MTEFIEFCREYGVYLLTFACFVIEIVFIFIKRKPKSIDDFLYCLNEIRLLVPEYVSGVECPGNGDVKKSTVMKILLQKFESRIGRKITEKESEIVANFLSSDIEAVLTAPQKKEIINEK